METRLEARTLTVAHRSMSGLVLVALLAGHAWSATGGSDTLGKTVGVKTPSHRAMLTGDKVNVRAGAGTHFYKCGWLNRNDTVEVWGEEAGWSKITPPPGSFSWVATKHIVVDAATPTVGIVVGREATVYAGSDEEKPMHSTAVQVALKRQDTVHLLNEEQDGYSKINPPPGSYLWVTSKYLQRYETATAVVVKAGTPAEKPPVNIEIPPKGEKSVVPAADVVPTVETALLAEYYAIKASIEEELLKPRGEQDYTEIEASLTKLAENEESDIVAKYAEIFLSRVGGYKLAVKVGQEVAVQNQLLQDATVRINKAKSQRLAAAPKLGRFAVIGILKKSNVNLRRYRIVTAKGRTLCYAQPVGALANEAMDKHLGKRVGLIGSIKAHAPSKSALVEFTKIEVDP